MRSNWSAPRCAFWPYLVQYGGLVGGCGWLRNDTLASILAEYAVDEGQRADQPGGVLTSRASSPRSRATNPTTTCTPVPGSATAKDARPELGRW
jgi:hypothetical protein